MRAEWSAGVVAVLLAGSAAGAETLPEALAAAYALNPDLAAQRALVRETDEGVPQALAFGRPGVSATVSEQQNAQNFSDNGRIFQAQLGVTQSLYRGGRTRIGVNAAENRILAARARLRSAENVVLVNTVTAYSDVLRYSALVDLNANQVKVLERQLQESKDRFEVGDLTRTDVAQAQGRLSGAQANLQTARGQLETARNAYRRVVGHAPDALQPVPPLPTLPGTPGQAIDLANVNNPDLIAARFDEAAARYDVQSLDRQRLPSVSVTGGPSYTQYTAGGGGGSFTSSLNGGFFSQSFTAQATIPFYQAGQVGSQIRQAQERRSQLLETIGSVGRQVGESTGNAFSSLQTARAVIRSSQVVVDADALALEGVKRENEVGQRTVIEVLNAEQELLQARANLVIARRDEYVAGYQLLAALGQAETDALQLPVERYDPEVNARKVRHEWGDFGNHNAPPQPLPDRDRASRSIPIGPPQ